MTWFGFRFRLQAKKIKAAMAAKSKSPTPAPIPAMAPVLILFLRGVVVIGFRILVEVGESGAEVAEGLLGDGPKVLPMAV